MLVVGRELRRDAIALQQPAGDAGIFASDDIHGGECLKCAQGDVAKIADRGGHQKESGRCLWRRDHMARDRKTAWFLLAMGRCRGGFCAHNGKLKWETALAPQSASAVGVPYSCGRRALVVEKPQI